MATSKQIEYKDHRRHNRSDYISYTLGKKQSDFCVLVLCYNSSDTINTLLRYIKKEQHYVSIDLIIIDNSQQEHTYQLESNGINSVLIRPKKNLGSAGGYALGMEYVINQGYNHFVMIEDDVILSDSGIIDMFYTSKLPTTLGFINPCLNTGGAHSWYVQCACYPVEFIKKIGVINPTYFFRSEDLEWQIRIEKGVKELGYAKNILDKNYYHPYLKKVNGTASRAYFALRNQLLMIKEHNTWNTHFIGTLFLYIRNSICRLLLGYGDQYIKAWIFALYDFLWGYRHKTNYERISQLSKKHILGINEQLLDYDNFKKKYSHYGIIGKSFQFSQVDIKDLGINNHFYNFIVRGSIIGGRNSILFPFYIISPVTVSIDEFILGHKKLYISISKNNILTGIIILIISCIISITLSMVVISILFFYILYHAIWPCKSQ
ncbi:MAG TPA: hypothetical protein PLW93_01550 [Candidatus Absconditabacterales bacterium]|nr:hypothetical protein [Candidatus Absconditabacterales bacterium]HNG96938.1 hypothetical protein [Candidatus Absconditabacterales bacterium]